MQQTVEHEKSKRRDTEEADFPKKALDGHKIKMWRAMLSETMRLLRRWMKVHKHGIYGSCAKAHKSTTIQNALIGLGRYQGSLPNEVLNQQADVWQRCRVFGSGK